MTSKLSSFSYKEPLENVIKSTKDLGITYRPDVDGLRAIAVLGVILYHFNPSWLPGGFAGVDVFFIISGYLISLIIFKGIDTKTFSFTNFYARRIKRLFPSMLFVLVSVFLLGWLVLYSSEFSSLGTHVTYVTTFLTNFLLIQEAGYFDTVSYFKPLLHFWSLAIEEQFYITWPLLVLVWAKIGWNRLSIIISILVLSITYSLFLASVDSIEHFFHPFSRAWELALGSLLAWFRLYRNFILTTKVAHALSCLGITLILISYFLFNGKLVYPGFWAVIPALGSSFIIIADRGIVNLFLSRRVFVFIGLISYPLYLWHWPIFSYLRIIEAGSPTMNMLMVGGVASVVMAWLTFSLIERPLRHSTSKVTVPSLVLITAALFSLGKTIANNEGYPDRKTPVSKNYNFQEVKRTPAFDENCHAYLNIANPPYYCKYTQGEGDFLAVIGDSHAHVVYDGLAELRFKNSKGTILLANSGCPPLLGTTIGRTPAEQQACKANINQMLELVKNNPLISYVLIVTRGPQYITGEGFGPAEKDYSYPPISSIDIDNDSHPSKLFEEGMKSTVSFLNAANKKVGYLLQVPEIGVSPKDCVGRPLSFTDKKICGVSELTYSERMERYRKIVNTVSKNVDMQVYDPKSIFCKKGFCSAVDEESLLYVDDNHLSILGSRRLAAKLDTLINKEIKDNED